MIRYFPWNDRWCIDGNMAYFIAGKYKLLLAYNFVSHSLNIMGELPLVAEQKKLFRSHSACLKDGETIYCLPTYGRGIYAYNTDLDTWDEAIGQSYTAPLLYRPWLTEQYICAIMQDSGTLFCLERQNGNISLVPFHPVTGQEFTLDRVNLDGKIYVAATFAPFVVEIDLSKGKTEDFMFPAPTNGFETICYDGKFFWLSGKDGKIYRWSRLKNQLDSIDFFPADFSLYEFDRNIETEDDSSGGYVAFVSSVYLGGHIWFIPFRANQILCLNPKQKKLQGFPLECESEDEQSWRRHAMAYKYNLLYVRQQRYLGLYSFKNKCVWEIDTKTRKVHHLEYRLSKNMYDFLFSQPFHESNEFKRNVFMQLDSVDVYKQEKKLGETAGSVIYRQLV